MPCTKEQLATAINSYSTARVTGDEALIQMAVNRLTELIDTLPFPEPEPEPEPAEADGGQE
jgi:hypothetical protein